MREAAYIETLGCYRALQSQLQVIHRNRAEEQHLAVGLKEIKMEGMGNFSL